MTNTVLRRIFYRTLAFGAAGAVIGLVTAQSAHALDVGYYEMCAGEGQVNQATAIAAAGHTPVDVLDLSPAELAGLDALFVDNCDNFQYAQEYLDHLPEIASAVANGMALVIHDRYVEDAEAILPGGGLFDVQRAAEPPGTREVDVFDDSTLLTSGPAGAITDASLDNGCESSHGFTVAGSVPEDARIILTRSDASQLVTFAYGYGKGAVVYSTIPLDFYLGGGSCNIGRTVRDVYAVNAVHYAAALSEAACGNGAIDAGEECDLGAGNNGGYLLRVRLLAARHGRDLPRPWRTATGGGLRRHVDVLSGRRDHAGRHRLPGRGRRLRHRRALQRHRRRCPADVAKPDSDRHSVCDLSTTATTSRPGRTTTTATARQRLRPVHACRHRLGEEQDRRAKLNTPPGDDRFTYVGQAILPPTPAIDPVANGVRVCSRTTPRWSARRDHPGRRVRQEHQGRLEGEPAGTALKYVDRAPRPIDGDQRHLRSQRRRRASSSDRPRQARQLLDATHEPPLAATLVLDPPMAETGQCTETTFGGGNCKFNASGATVTCK